MKLQGRNNQIVEFYINDKFFDSCSYNQWNKVERKHKKMFSNKCYVEVYVDCQSYNRTKRHKHRHNETVYVNLDTCKVAVYYYKISTGVKDKNGCTLYIDDAVKSPLKVDTGFRDNNGNIIYDNDFSDHFIARLNYYHEYYLRTPDDRYNQREYIINESGLSILEKVEDYCRFEKKYWKTSNIEKITIKDL